MVDGDEGNARFVLDGQNLDDGPFERILEERRALARVLRNLRERRRHDGGLAAHDADLADQVAVDDGPEPPRLDGMAVPKAQRHDQVARRRVVVVLEGQVARRAGAVRDAVRTSARSGEGIEGWLGWLRGGRA